MARYGELFLKSEPVKRHFIGILLRNVGKALSASGLFYHFETPRGRILIHGDQPSEIAGIVSRILASLMSVSVHGQTPGLKISVMRQSHWHQQTFMRE
jgi:thiamine biosynthesis protein ThiI